MAWDKTKCAEGILAPDFNDEVREQYIALEAALTKEMYFSTGGTASLQGILKQGGARPFFQDSAPATRLDGSAFASTDLGLLWIDSNSSPDNQFNILTATTPTWTPISTEIIATLLAAARTFAFADATLTLQNTDEEDSDGGRQSKFVVKGEQSGGEVTTLGYIEFSHEGASDDQKGQFVLMLNDGDDNNAPSKQPIGFQSTGKIDVPNSLSVLDEDNMASNDAEVVATQQSIKKYVDDSLAGMFGVWNDRDKDGSADSIAADTEYTAETDGFIVGSTNVIGVSQMTIETPTGTIRQNVQAANGSTASFCVPVKSGDTWKIVVTSGTASYQFWMPLGA